MEQAEHQTHKLRVLDEGLLCPVDHGVGDEFLKSAFGKEGQQVCQKNERATVE